jgi:geranylgeranyl reductase family protein
MMPMTHFDVLVAGAGPAGSACATLMARSGLNVLLCDKEQFPRDKICGDCINPGCWKYFEMLGVADSLRKLDLHRIESARMANLSGKQITVPVRATPSRPFFSIKRSTLDNLLVQHAEREGVSFLQQTRFLDATFSDVWNVVVRSKNGLETYSCDYLVGADGRNSTIANKIGAWSRKNPSKTARRVGIQWHADVQPRVGSEVQLYTMKEGYFGIVNVDVQNSNVAMVTSPDIARDALANLPRFIERTVYSNPIIGRYATQIEPRCGVVTTYPVNPIRRHWNHPKALLVGDARQTVEPFTGEGVLFALDDGARAARQISTLFDKKVRRTARPRANFWVNRVVSPTLRNQKLVESLVWVASEISWLPRLFARTVFRTSL